MDVFIYGEDSVPPGAVRYMGSETDGLPEGEALVTWKTPKDLGGWKTLGFNVKYLKGGEEISFPIYLIPLAGKPGDDVKMHIHDLPFASEESVRLIISPVDSVGNTGPMRRFRIKIAKNLEMHSWNLQPIAMKKDGMIRSFSFTLTTRSTTAKPLIEVQLRGSLMSQLIHRISGLSGGTVFSGNHLLRIAKDGPECGFAGIYHLASSLETSFWGLPISNTLAEITFRKHA
jgi:hypothetical protein